MYFQLVTNVYKLNKSNNLKNVNSAYKLDYLNSPKYFKL